MAPKKPPPCDPILGIRRFAGPTTFHWIGMSYKNKWLLLRPLWLPQESYPKPRFPPGFVSFKPPPRWPKDRRPVLSNTYVNVRLFRGLEGIQEKYGELSQASVFIRQWKEQLWKAARQHGR